MTPPTASLPPPPPPSAPPPPRPRRRAFAGYGVEAVVLALVLVFAVAVVLPTWLMGGFGQVPKKGLPEIQPSQTISYGEYRISPLNAKLTPANPTGEYNTKKNMQYLTVQVRVENRTKESAYGFEDLVLVGSPIFAKLSPPEQSGLVRDGSGVQVLQSGVPEIVQLIWEIPRTTAVPPGVKVTIQRNSYNEGFFDKKMRWSAPDPWVVVTLPVTRVGI
ncbi:MAG: hypothetical protein GEV10_02275 [Streptosporangiales bacterium]|nr:hypothetical protein [Streptosporangiales bacterium]